MKITSTVRDSKKLYLTTVEFYQLNSAYSYNIIFLPYAYRTNHSYYLKYYI